MAADGLIGINSNLEIGGGLGALQGKIWRIGLMGDSCKVSNVLLVHALLTILLRRASAMS